MPVPPTIDDVARRLGELYDPGSIERGRAYAAEGRVKVLSSAPGQVRAVCRGSGQATYVVSIRWEHWQGGLDVDDSCTCPLEGECKHCVATILTVAGQASPSGAPAPIQPPATDWRRSLSDILLAHITEDAATAGFVLQVAVEHPKPGPFGTATGPRVTVRPMRWGKAGKWIKTGASWRDVQSPYDFGPIQGDPAQRGALRLLLATAKTDTYYQASEAVALSHFTPEVWPLLDRAVGVGVVLIGQRADEAIELASEVARVEVDLVADGSGAIEVRTGVAIGEESVRLDVGLVGLVGMPPHGLWIQDGERLRLARFARPLHPDVASLLASGAFRVPAADVDEFLDVYQPALARHATVGSSDGSVTITDTRFDQLVLIVRRTALDTAIAQWTARYRRGDRVTDHPVHRPFGQGRERAVEAAAMAEVELPVDLLPALVDADGRARDLAVGGTDTITLLTQVLPWLEAKGVEVEVTGGLPELREATTDPLIELTVTDGAATRDGNDWFDLDVQVSVDGEVVDFVSLFTALNLDREALILPSGTWLRLDRPEFERLRTLIEEARGLAEPGPNGVARVNQFQADWWEELAALGVVSEQSQRWAESIQRMAALSAPEPVPVPAGLDATLRHYQQEGFEWLAFLHRNQLGGILADDMGLGKTVQALALCLHILEEKPDARMLVVAPTSVVDNWAREAARFAPGVSVRAIRETKARRGTELADEIDGAGLVLTSYALFRLEFEAYAAHDWEVLLLDEAQFVKNHQGKTYQCARRLEAATKIAMTGTPLENTLMDLWSLLSITAPGLYPDPKRFGDTYRKPIENGTAPHLLATLKQRIAPLMRRRTKDQVLTELPPKTEQTIEVELSPRHAKIYATQLQRQRQKVLGLVGDVQKHRFEIFRSLTLLRQLALHPGLVDEADDHVGSAKLDRLLEDLTQIVAEGHKALVFSQFTRYLGRARTRLDAAGIGYSYLDGKTRKRDEAIGRFKGGEVPVFLISLKAGGFGLNLAEADYCFVLDPWWNPATEAQAVDRAHRMGQLNPVMVYRYVSTNTIEEKVMELKARKAALFSSVVDEEGALAGALTESDIRGLLDLS